MNRAVVFVTMVLSAVTISACGKNGASKEPLSKPPVAVESSTAKPAEMLEYIEVTGNLEPKFSVDVKTQIPGLVKQVFVNEWIRVKRGQPLAVIDVSETEAQVKRGEAGIAAARAGLAQARVAANRAEREFARMVKLKESGLATQQALDDASTEKEAAQSKIDSAMAQIRVAEEETRQGMARRAKGSVTAPIDGVVALRNVNVGDLASDAAAGKPIFRIVDNRILNLTVSVSSTDSGRVKVGQPLEFTVDSQPGVNFTGKIMFINPELSATDRSLKVIAEVSNVPETLKGGLFAKGRIVTGRRADVLQVPRSAVAALDLSGGKGVMYVVENGSARKREIAVGVANGDLIEVKSGIRSGERYVTRGGFNLKDGDSVTADGKTK